MPIYSVKEFAELTGCQPKNIHTYAQRGKIVKNKNKQIDTTNPVNNVFFEERRVNGKATITTKPESKSKEKPKNDEKPPSISSHQKVLEEKARLDLDLKRRDLELKEIELSKKRGELVDLEQTGVLISQYVGLTNKKLCSNIETFIQDICARHNIETSKAGKYKENIREIINKINEESVNDIFDKIK